MSPSPWPTNPPSGGSGTGGGSGSTSSSPSPSPTTFSPTTRATTAVTTYHVKSTLRLGGITSIEQFSTVVEASFKAVVAARLGVASDDVTIVAVTAVGVAASSPSVSASRRRRRRRLAAATAVDVRFDVLVQSASDAKTAVTALSGTGTAASSDANGFVGELNAAVAQAGGGAAITAVSVEDSPIIEVKSSSTERHQAKAEDSEEVTIDVGAAVGITVGSIAGAVLLVALVAAGVVGTIVLRARHAKNVGAFVARWTNDDAEIEVDGIGMTPTPCWDQGGAALARPHSTSSPGVGRDRDCGIARAAEEEAAARAENERLKLEVENAKLRQELETIRSSSIDSEVEKGVEVEDAAAEAATPGEVKAIAIQLAAGATMSV